MDGTVTELDRLLPRTAQTPRGAVVVRRASEDDAPAVMRMHHRCSTDTVFRRYFSAVPALSPQLQARLLGTRLCLVAEVGHEIVGMAHLADAAGQPLELAVLVEDGWQRYGVGLALGEAALDVAELWGAPKVVTYTLQSSTGAHALLRRLRAGALHPEFHSGEDGFVHAHVPLRTPGLRSA
jgi:GNAT superfamily N-acetyltransferase